MGEDSCDADEEPATSGRGDPRGGVAAVRPVGHQGGLILGVRRATLSDLTNGKTAVSAEMALRLEKAFGVSMDLLLRMQAGYDAAEVRRRSAEIEVLRYRPDVAAATD